MTKAITLKMKIFNRIHGLWSYIIKFVKLSLIVFVLLGIGLWLSRTNFNIKLFNRENGFSPYTQHGTNYGEEAIKIYDSSRDFPYIAKFLIPNFLPELENLKEQKILDAGCGVGLWSIYAAKNGGKIFGIDIQPGMIREARIKATKAKLENQVDFIIGDVANLLYRAEYFEKAISINVACNLPKSSLYKHFKEFHRVLKKGGKAIVAVPISHEILFTNGKKSSKEIRELIDNELSLLESNPSPKKIRQVLNSLEGILSATFTIENGRLALVTNSAQLKEGQEVWRKLPQITLPNRYYSEKMLEKAFKKAKLKIKKVLHPKFSSEAEMMKYNSNVDVSSRMGIEYVKYSPFVIYYLENQ